MNYSDKYELVKFASSISEEGFEKNAFLKGLARTAFRMTPIGMGLGLAAGAAGLATKRGQQRMRDSMTGFRNAWSGGGQEGQGLGYALKNLMGVATAAPEALSDKYKYMRQGFGNFMNQAQQAQNADVANSYQQSLRAPTSFTPAPYTDAFNKNYNVGPDTSMYNAPAPASTGIPVNPGGYLPGPYSTSSFPNFNSAQYRLG